MDHPLRTEERLETLLIPQIPFTTRSFLAAQFRSMLRNRNKCSGSAVQSRPWTTNPEITTVSTERITDSSGGHTRNTPPEILIDRRPPRRSAAVGGDFQEEMVRLSILHTIRQSVCCVQRNRNRIITHRCMSTTFSNTNV